MSEPLQRRVCRNISSVLSDYSVPFPVFDILHDIVSCHFGHYTVSMLSFDSEAIRSKLSRRFRGSEEFSKTPALSERRHVRLRAAGTGLDG